MRRFLSLLRHEPWLIGLLAPAVLLSGFWGYQAFVNPNPAIRILLRALPVLPPAIWVLYFDRSRPLERASRPARTTGRAALLAGTMAFALLVLGFGLDWLYEPK